jgi:hypothetical protein
MTIDDFQLKRDKLSVKVHRISKPEYILFGVDHKQNHDALMYRLIQVYARSNIWKHQYN